MKKLIALVGCLTVSAVLHAADPNYHVVKEIQIGGDGGWDYISVDPVGHRIYVSHATKVVVVRHPHVSHPVANPLQVGLPPFPGVLLRQRVGEERPVFVKDFQ